MRAPRWRRLLVLRGRHLRAEGDNELRFHLEMKAQEFIAAGMEPALAHERAAATFGVIDDVRDACVAIDEHKERRLRREDIMSALIQDLRYAWRNVRSTPAFTGIIALTLAIGIGANAAIFSLVDGVLLKPLAYPEPDRLVAVQDVQRGAPIPVAYPEFHAWREGHESVFTDMAAFFQTGSVLTGAGEPQALRGARMSWTLPGLLGTPLLLGRGFAEEENDHNAPRVVMISERLFREHFSADPGTIGRAIYLNDNPWTVIGVYRTTPHSTVPFGHGDSRPLDFWMPLRIDPSQQWLEGLHFMTVIARLRPEVTIATARAFMDRQARLLQEAGTSRHDARVDPLQDRMLGDVGRYLGVLVGAVALVLLIASVNVANLLLARAAGRQREIAIRVAIGAGRARVVSQLLVESLIRAALGGALGILVAYGALGAFRHWLPARLPRFDEVTIDTRVLVFLVAVSVVTGIVFGLVPALRTSRVDLVTSLRDGGRGLVGSIRRDRLRRALVVAEVALSFVLLVGAGLLARSLQQKLSVPRGFAVTEALTAYVALPPSRYPDSTRQVAFFDLALERLAALPGVRGAAAASDLPLEGGTNGGINIEGREFAPDDRPMAEKRIVSTNYFDVLGARFIQGRGFNARDRSGGMPVVVVNETFAKRHLADGNPVGRRVDFLWGTSGMQTVVGVVADIRERNLDQPPAAAVYIPMTQRAVDGANFIVAVTGRAEDYVNPVRREVLAIDPNLPVSNVRTMDQVIAELQSRDRLATALFGTFSIIALVLAGIGVYGVISYGVAQRTPEIGVRTALGARRSDIAGLVLGEGAWLVGIGILMGAGGALLGTRALQSQLFGVGPTDPATFAMAAGVLLVAAAVATAAPSWRAARIDPLSALRQE